MACVRRATHPGRGRDVQCDEEGCEFRLITDGSAAQDLGDASQGDCVLQLQLRVGDASRARFIDWDLVRERQQILELQGPILFLNDGEIEEFKPEWRPGRVRIGPKTLIETFVDDEPALREWIQLELLRMFRDEMRDVLFSDEPVGERRPEPGVRTYDDNSGGVV